MRTNTRTKMRTSTRTRPGTRAADPKVALLRGLPSLAAVRERDLATVAPMVEELEVPAGTVLVTEGATCHEVLLVLDGQAVVSVGGAPVGRVGPGDVVGDLAVRQGTPHDTTVTAEGPIHVLVAGPESYRAFVRHPVIVRAAAAGLSDRLRRADAGRFASDSSPMSV